MAIERLLPEQVGRCSGLLFKNSGMDAVWLYVEVLVVAAFVISVASVWIEAIHARKQLQRRRVRKPDEFVGLV